MEEINKKDILKLDKYNKIAILKDTFWESIQWVFRLLNYQKLFWLSDHQLENVKEINVRKNDREKWHIIHMRYELEDSWFDYELWTDEIIWNVSYSSINKDNNNINLSDIIIRQLHNFSEYDLSIETEAARSWDWTDNMLYGYNIRPKYGYDVTEINKRWMFEKLRILTHKDIVVDELEVEEIQNELFNFLDQYDSENLNWKLLMPKLFENPVLRKVWRKYWWSFPCEIKFQDGHATWAYFRQHYWISSIQD